MSTAEVQTPPPKAVENDPYDRDRFEIIDGVSKELPPMSAESTGVAADLEFALNSYGVAQNVGKAYSDMLVKLPLDRDRNRRPDVVFVPFSRWSRGRRLPDTNAWAVLPEVCVEVVSPTDNAEEITEKIREYFESGVRLVWVVYPRQGLVYAYESPVVVHGLTRADTLDGGNVLPGFRLPLTELFPEVA